MLRKLFFVSLNPPNLRSSSSSSSRPALPVDVVVGQHRFRIDKYQPTVGQHDHAVVEAQLVADWHPRDNQQIGQLRWMDGGNFFSSNEWLLWLGDS
jgi:hypothetical protein